MVRVITCILASFLLSSCLGSQKIEYVGQSMYPTFSDQEILTYSTDIQNIKRGDIVVVDYINKPERLYVKRIIGVGGDSIKIHEGEVFIKKTGESEYKLLEEAYISNDNPNYKSTMIKNSRDEEIFNVPESEFFLLGDNRNATTDSRNCFGSCSVSTPYLGISNIKGIVK